MVDIFILILCVVIGNFIGNYLFGLYQAIKLKKSIFKKDYFKDTDFDFYSDINNGNSITDIKIENIKEE